MKKEKKIYDDIKKINDDNKIFVTESTEIRNLIFIGRTRCGKSTAIKVIKNPISISDSLQLFSETKNPNLTTMLINDKENNKYYVFNIIDTPGLFELIKIEKIKEEIKIEIGTDDTRLRNDEELLNLIDDCMKKEITRIHLICFVCDISNGINENDIDAIIKIKQKYNFNIGKQSMLLFTHCKDNEECERLIKDFFKHPKVVDNKLEDYLKQGYSFLGALNNDDFKNAADSLLIQFENVFNYRNNFINKIITIGVDNNFEVEKRKLKDNCVII